MLGVFRCIAWQESSYNNAATDNDSNGTTDFGLFQINSGYWCQGPNTQSNGCNVSCDQLYGSGSDSLNAQCAYTIYSQQGLTAWATYNSGLCSSKYVIFGTEVSLCLTCSFCLFIAGNSPTLATSIAKMSNRQLVGCAGQRGEVMFSFI